MDAKTHPHGVLEEVEESPDKVEESPETGSNERQCRNTGMFKERVLAHSGKPDYEHSPLKPKA